MSKKVSPTKICHCRDKIPLSSQLPSHLEDISKEGINRDVCRDLPVKYEHEGNFYCILHFPNKDKSDDFEKVVKERLSKQEYKFQAVWFPRRTNYFHEFHFKDNEVNFSFAHFFAKADFWHAVFSTKTSFEFATFDNEALFTFATFTVANFHEVKFWGSVYFGNTKFSEMAYFESSRFSYGANFIFAELKHAFFSEIVFLKNKLNEFDEDKLSFYDAKFFDLTDFSRIKFPTSTDFRNAVFNNQVLFIGSTFKEVYFDKAEFTSKSFFSFSQFEEKVLFSEVSFSKETDFSNCSFISSVKFLSETNKLLFLPKSTLSFEHSYAEKPNQISFHTVNLRPSDFINVDSRQFIFTNIDWENADGSPKAIKNEIKILKKRKILNPYKLLTITCRQLAENAEENNRLEEASNFRKMVFEIEWLEKKEKFWNWINRIPKESEKLKRRVGGSTQKEDEAVQPANTFGIVKRFDFLHPVYRFTSYYGESWRRAFVILFVILAISTFLYTTSYCVFKDGKQGFDIWEAISYSLRVMALQRPEPFPENSFAKMVVALQSIFAPLQLALLALAIRRKFMR